MDQLNFLRFNVESATPDEIILWALRLPLRDLDEVESALSGHRAEILERVKKKSRLDFIDGLPQGEFVLGPYGLVGPCGGFGLVCSALSAFFGIQHFGVLLLTFLVGHAISFFFAIRTRAATTSDYLERNSIRPANAGFFVSWMIDHCPDSVTAAHLNLFIDGINDSTDYWIERARIGFQKLSTDQQRRVRANLHRSVEQLITVKPTRTIGEIAPHDLSIVDAQSFDSYAFDPFESVDIARQKILSLASSDSPSAVSILDGWRAYESAGIEELVTSVLRERWSLKTSQRLDDAIDYHLLEYPPNRDYVLERRLRDMKTGRRIPIGLFEKMKKFPGHDSILFGLYGDTLFDTFRIDELFECVGPDDQPVALQPFTTVGVVHPLDLSERLFNAWSDVFTDYELVSFGQLGRPTYSLEDVAVQRHLVLVPHEHEVIDVREVLIDAGWKELDLRWIRNVRFQSDKYQASVEIFRDQLTLAFVQGHHDVDPDFLPIVPLRNVPAVLFSEVYYELHTLTEQSIQ